MGAGRIRREPSGTALAGSRPWGVLRPPAPRPSLPCLWPELVLRSRVRVTMTGVHGPACVRERACVLVSSCGPRTAGRPHRWMSSLTRMLVSLFEASATVAGSPGGAPALAFFANLRSFRKAAARLSALLYDGMHRHRSHYIVTASLCVLKSFVRAGEARSLPGFACSADVWTSTCRSTCGTRTRTRRCAAYA